MKRDMDLIRKMVLTLEDAPTGFVQDLKIEGDYTQEQVGYHAYLMVDGGLAEGSRVTTLNGTSPQYVISHLTWEGHEFADEARNEPRWKKAMDILQEKSSTAGMDVIKALLVHLAKTGLGL